MIASDFVFCRRLIAQRITFPLVPDCLSIKSHHQEAKPRRSPLIDHRFSQIADSAQIVDYQKSTATIIENSTISPMVRIEAQCEIRNSFIAPNVKLAKNCKIGANSYLGEKVKSKIYL